MADSHPPLPQPLSPLPPKTSRMWMAPVGKWIKEPRHRLFIVLQLSSVFAALIFFALAVFVEWFPPPGVAVAILAGLAAAMSLHGEMRRSHKALWMLIIGAFLVIELLSIVHERNEQNIHFNEIGKRIQKTIDDSQKHFDATMKDSREHFDITMARSDALYRAESRTTNLALHALEQIEGGDGYCWLAPIPPPSQVATNPLWSMIASCEDKKKLPIVDVFVVVQEALSEHPASEEIDAKLWHGPHFYLGTLPSGGWVPTDIALKSGKYNISIFTRRNAVLEQISFGGLDSKTQTWDAKSCVYQYQTGELLTGNTTCRKRR